MNEGFETLERLRVELSLLPHDVQAGEPLRVTASFGLAPLEPGIPVEETIERADKALYGAKEAGRNRGLIWDPSMTVGSATAHQNSAA